MRTPTGGAPWSGSDDLWDSRGKPVDRPIPPDLIVGPIERSERKGIKTQEIILMMREKNADHNYEQSKCIMMAISWRKQCGAKT
ncbi:hypothetical protein IIC65_02905 [Candidatus Sumerlaeota bacterium]|nr:hypothetical protein [Candidatus Sumerlaeota bacterium]